jgi:hypothetical protein
MEGNPLLGMELSLLITAPMDDLGGKGCMSFGSFDRLNVYAFSIQAKHSTNQEMELNIDATRHTLSYLDSAAPSII